MEREENGRPGTDVPATTYRILCKTRVRAFAASTVPIPEHINKEPESLQELLEQIYGILLLCDEAMDKWYANINRRMKKEISKSKRKDLKKIRMFSSDNDGIAPLFDLFWGVKRRIFYEEYENITSPAQIQAIEEADACFVAHIMEAGEYYRSLIKAETLEMLEAGAKSTGEQVKFAVGALVFAGLTQNQSHGQI